MMQMAFTEYYCRDCGYDWFANGGKCCPKCKGTNLHAIADE